MKIEVLLWESFGGLICTLLTPERQLGQSAAIDPQEKQTELAVAGAVENMLSRVASRDPGCREHVHPELQYTKRIIALEEKLAAAEAEVVRLAAVKQALSVFMARDTLSPWSPYILLAYVNDVAHGRTEAPEDES